MWVSCWSLYILKIHLWCVNLLSKQCGQGRSYCSLCTLDTIHRFFFATRLIINKTNEVQWVDFKLENVLVSLHSLKTMGLDPFGASAPLFLRNGELLGHSPMQNNQAVKTMYHLVQFYWHTFKMCLINNSTQIMWSSRSSKF